MSKVFRHGCFMAFNIFTTQDKENRLFYSSYISLPKLVYIFRDYSVSIIYFSPIPVPSLLPYFQKNSNRTSTIFAIYREMDFTAFFSYRFILSDTHFWIEVCCSWYSVSFFISSTTVAFSFASSAGRWVCAVFEFPGEKLPVSLRG